ncbi:hypothetical protein E1264_13105 [Actinomadura sp. KC216]|nr:hypothetical protein E1264_13105 [Actinomadura sp. KC216]
MLDELGACGMVDWSAAIVDATAVRAQKGSMTGPNPVDRAKKGSKLHVLSDAEGLPLVVGISAANTADIEAFKPLFMAIPAIRSRRGPRAYRPQTNEKVERYNRTLLDEWASTHPYTSETQHREALPQLSTTPHS